MNREDLPQVLNWRNHPDVRQFMYTSHVITPEEHARWYARMSCQEGIWLLIFEVGAVAKGFVNISRTRCQHVADWGFYLSPDSEKGTGKLLGRAVLEYAFDELGLHKLCGQALGFNERSIRFHERLGFNREGVLRDQHCDGNGFHDVVCFGLLSSEWRCGNRQREGHQ
ncbi:UDP-4-amino-4,6-dideoxy-N-acetyl-beta-L-altrosamine N-acetyltransferase [Marinobacter salinexigens]|uniref:UDP-4-amino-4, 6-dideoxy-N-acetyl-beta-L-altrosamine N-acetyltransferase n=2 Tax=Marinobacter salinexigens TaxID=2919747 RepID=A0A5B0VMI9_9GAMM|nr:UDP-4-amino-4,6-dideoxy-N-acetyl-beta-L-altrosamine N-acetyltransferase [Marinobacter salinexigens]